MLGKSFQGLNHSGSMDNGSSLLKFDPQTVDLHMYSSLPHLQIFSGLICISTCQVIYQEHQRMPLHTEEGWLISTTTLPLHPSTSKSDGRSSSQRLSNPSSESRIIGGDLSGNTKAAVMCMDFYGWRMHLPLIHWTPVIQPHSNHSLTSGINMSQLGIQTRLALLQLFTNLLMSLQH